MGCILRQHVFATFKKKKKMLACMSYVLCWHDFQTLADCWWVVLGFNATLTAKVISWQSMTHMCFLAFSHQYYKNFSFQSHRLLFSHATAKVRGENTPKRKVASTGDRTHNHQVMSPTRSPLSHPGRAWLIALFTSLYCQFTQFTTY